jgi:hypothetical protein
VITIKNLLNEEKKKEKRNKIQDLNKESVGSCKGSDTMLNSERIELSNLFLLSLIDYMKQRSYIDNRKIKLTTGEITILSLTD